MRTSNKDKYAKSNNTDDSKSRGAKRTYNSYKTDETKVRTGYQKPVKSAIPAFRVPKPVVVPPRTGETTLNALGKSLYSQNYPELPGLGAKRIPLAKSSFTTVTRESHIINTVSDEWIPTIITNTVLYNGYDTTTKTLDFGYPEFDGFRRLYPIVQTAASNSLYIKALYFGDAPSGEATDSIDFDKTVEVLDISGNSTQVPAAFMYLYECDEFSAALSALIVYSQKMHIRSNYFAKKFSYLDQNTFTSGEPAITTKTSYINNADNLSSTQYLENLHAMLNRVNDFFVIPSLVKQYCKVHNIADLDSAYSPSSPVIKTRLKLSKAPIDTDGPASKLRAGYTSAGSVDVTAKLMDTWTALNTAITTMNQIDDNLAQGISISTTDTEGNTTNLYAQLFSEIINAFDSLMNSTRYMREMIMFAQSLGDRTGNLADYEVSDKTINAVGADNTVGYGANEEMIFEIIAFNYKPIGTPVVPPTVQFAPALKGSDFIKKVVFDIMHAPDEFMFAFNNRCSLTSKTTAMRGVYGDGDTSDLKQFNPTTGVFDTVTMDKIEYIMNYWFIAAGMPWASSQMKPIGKGSYTEQVSLINLENKLMNESFQNSIFKMIPTRGR